MRHLAEVGREIWRRIQLEFRVELPLLRKRWKQVVFGALFQYCHGLATQLAHRMHRPMAQPLHDVGFALLPEVGLVNEWVSETIFNTLFVSFVVWTFSPFWTGTKRFYTAVIYARLLMVLCVCQTLRIISFTVTQLPAPNYHCRIPELTAIKPMPEHWWGHFYIQNIAKQATHGCGDLIFSSHTTFMLVGLLTYTEYGTRLPIKLLAWSAVAVVSTLIVASRKHYSVDVVIAWYVVPLVFYTMLRRWTTRRSEEKWPHRPLAGDEDTDEEQDDVVEDLAEIMVSSEGDTARQVELALARQPLVPPPSLTNGLLDGGVPSPAAVKAAAGSLKAAAGSTKAAAATNSLYGQQGGPATEALKVASKGLLDDADGAEAGLLPGRIPGSNSLMRPRSQQFPPGASTDSEREDGSPPHQRRDQGGGNDHVGAWWPWQR